MVQGLSRRVPAILRRAIFSMLEWLSFLFMKMKSKLSSIRLKWILMCLEQLFIVEQFSLEILKGDLYITVAIVEGGDKCMVRGVESSNHIGDKIFIFNPFAYCGKLIGKVLGCEQVICATFRPLADGLKLPLEVGNSGSRDRREPLC